MKRVVLAVVSFAILIVVCSAVYVVRAQNRGSTTLPGPPIASGQPQYQSSPSPVFGQPSSRQSPPTLSPSNPPSLAPQSGPYTEAGSSSTFGYGSSKISKTQQSKFLQLSNRLSQLLDEKGIQEEIARTETRIAELEAKKAVAQASQILNTVLNKYPTTEAAGDARKMLGIHGEAEVDKASFEQYSEQLESDRDSAGPDPGNSRAGESSPELPAPASRLNDPPAIESRPRFNEE